jgi:uncharacterized membrane protein
MMLGPNVARILNYVATGVALAGVAILIWGALLSLVRLVYREFTRLRGRHIWQERERIRHQFGSYLLLGLEFLIAADIIMTIVDPALVEVAILGGIVLIRTVISFFLDREMRHWYQDSFAAEPGEGGVRPRS